MLNILHLPSHDNVTSANKSDLKRFENVMAKFDEYEFHFKQNCCWGSMMIYEKLKKKTQTPNQTNAKL